MLRMDHRPQVHAELRRTRRAMAAKSPQAFAQIYLPHHFTAPPSRMHDELFTLLAAAVESRARRLAVAAPRGHAKTTVVSLAYVLWCVLYRREMFVLLVSATKEQAVLLLKTVKDELQVNRRLLEDFPETCYPPGARPAPKPWRDNQIVLRNGVAVRALGSDQAVRGMKHSQHRPSLIIADDLEDPEETYSAEQRRKLREWFEKTLLKAGNKETNIIVVGTIVHYDSLLASLVNPRPGQRCGWDGRIYRAVESFSTHPELWEKWEAIYKEAESYEDRQGEEAARAFYEAHQSQMLAGTRVLWPQQEDYEQLMIERASGGHFSFQSEKQNEPLDPDECIFSEQSLTYWDDDYADAAEVLAALGTKAQLFGACDPSLGRRPGRGDYTAIVILARDQDSGTMFVLDADIRRRKPDEIIERIIALAQAYDFSQFVAEANQFQEVLADNLSARARRAGVRLPLKKITSTANKQVRIESLEPFISQGTLRFSRRQQLLLEQLRQFPLGAHDDGPDALEMAVQAAHRRRHRVYIQQY